jgi:hypothetical protein
MYYSSEYSISALYKDIMRTQTAVNE